MKEVLYVRETYIGLLASSFNVVDLSRFQYLIIQAKAEEFFVSQKLKSLLFKLSMSKIPFQLMVMSEEMAFTCLLSDKSLSLYSVIPTLGGNRCYFEAIEVSTY